MAWANQTAGVTSSDNELGLEFIYERKWRSFLFGTRSQGFGMDVIGHAGVALGNVQTYGNAGLELRLGWNVPTILARR